MSTNTPTSSSHLEPLSSGPFTVDVPPQLVNFRQPRRSFTLHNARKKPIDIMFGGNRMTLPASHQVDRDHSDTDLDGDLIPGSFVIEDTYLWMSDIQDEVCILDAIKCVCHILGLQVGSDGSATVATSPYALSGISLIPRHATKEQWKQVAELGEKRSFLAEVERARVYIAAMDEANEKRRVAGYMPVRDRDYERGVTLLNQYNELVKAHTVEAVAPHQSDAEIDELELDTIARAMATDIVTRVADEKNITDEGQRMQLLRTLLDDPRLRKRAQREFVIRKKASKPVSDIELDAMIASGATSVKKGGGDK